MPPVHLCSPTLTSNRSMSFTNWLGLIETMMSGRIISVIFLWEPLVVKRILDFNSCGSLINYQVAILPCFVTCRLTEQYEEASLHLWDLLEGRDKAVAGTTCELLLACDSPSHTHNKLMHLYLIIWPCVYLVFLLCFLCFQTSHWRTLWRKCC